MKNLEMISRATGYPVEAFEALENDNPIEAAKIAPGIFVFCDDGPMGPEYQLSNEVIPYLDETVKWNPKTQQFEGVFWGTLQREEFELRGWVTVDASDSCGYIPIEFEVQTVETPDGEEISALEHGINALMTEGIEEVEYEI